MTPCFEDYKDHAHALIEASLDAADPAKALARHWNDSELGDDVVLLAVGKGARPMALEALRRLGSRCKAGIVTAPPDQADAAGFAGYPVQVFPCDHPFPTQRNIDAAPSVQELVATMRPSQTLVCLITGGGSAHLTLPAPGLTLQHLADTTRVLQRAGATIDDLNCVRKHCEQLKGGRLAAMCPAGRVVSYILSDVIGDKLDVIASGPTAPDPTTFGDALRVLENRGLTSDCELVAAHLRVGAQGGAHETPKPGDPTFARVTNAIIASNSLVVDAIAAHAAALGFVVAHVEQDVTGEAAAVGAALAKHAMPRFNKAHCSILGGETTVTVGDTAGSGGPSQELALSAAIELDRRGLSGNTVIVTFSTDGRDGPTDAAGAIIGPGFCAQAKAQGLDPEQALKNHDSHTLFDKLGCLIRVPPTGTNLNHIAALLVYP